MDGQSLWASIHPHLITWANGLLVCAYWTWDHAALLAAIACGLTILFTCDRAVQRTAGERLLRYARGARLQASYRPQIESLATLLLWSIAALLSSPPIPAIGAAMWAAFLIALKLIPQERESLLFRQKTMIAGYGLLSIALYLALSYSPDVDYAALLGGGRGEAAGLFDSVRDGLLPYAALIVWVLYPLGYFSVLVQRFAINRGSLLKPGGTPEDYVRHLRARGQN